MYAGVWMGRVGYRQGIGKGWVFYGTVYTDLNVCTLLREGCAGNAELRLYLGVVRVHH
jgi:hypothetical protein